MLAGSRNRAAVCAAASLIALAGCGDDDRPEELTQESACKAVEDNLQVRDVEKRFGEPASKQDFFGDTVITYRREDVEWRFHVGAATGTFRAIRHEKDEVEEVLPCRG